MDAESDTNILMAIQKNDLDHIKSEMINISENMRNISKNTAEITTTYAKELISISASMAELHANMSGLKDADIRIFKQLNDMNIAINDHARKITFLGKEAIRYKGKADALNNEVRDLKGEVNVVKKENKLMHQLFGKFSVYKSTISVLIAILLVFAKDICKWFWSFFP